MKDGDKGIQGLLICHPGDQRSDECAVELRVAGVDYLVRFGNKSGYVGVTDDPLVCKHMVAPGLAGKMFVLPH